MSSLKELLQSVDLREIVAQTWGDGKRSGKSVIYRSRWRNDDDHASFAVYADGFKDFGGSGESGSSLDWLCREYNWSIREAIDYLKSKNIRVSLENSKSPARTSFSPPRIRGGAGVGLLPAPPSLLWHNHAEALMRTAENYLWSDAPDAQRARWYLCTIRGLSEETIRQHRLGYNPTPKHYRDASQKLWLPAGITIPRLANNTLWAIRVRSRVGNLAEALGIEPDRFTYGDRKGEQIDKYLSLTGSQPGAAPFNADALRFRSRDVLIVEGEFDAALAGQILGDQAAVITMGSATSAIPQAWIDKLRGARHVYSCMDADGAGQAGADRLAAALDDKHTALKLPQGKDITEFVVDHGGDLLTWWAARRQAGQGWWRKDVPDSVRSAVLTYLLPSAAPLLERLNQALNAGRLDPNYITIPQCKRLNRELGWGFAEPTLDRAFRSLEGVFLSKLPPEKTLTNRQVSSPKKAEGNNDKNSPAPNPEGKPPDVFVKLPLPQSKAFIKQYAHPRIRENTHPIHGEQRISALKSPPPDSAIDFEHLAESRRADQRALSLMLSLMSGLEDTTSTPLSGDYHNAATYRRQYIRAQTAARVGTPGERRSRKSIAAALGADIRSVKSMLGQAGIKSEAQFEQVRFTSLESLTLQIDAACREKSGFPRAWVLESAHGIEEIAFNPTQALTVVAAAFAQGKQVFLRLQVASKRTLADEVSPAKPAKRSSTVKRSLPADTHVPKSKLQGRRFVGLGFDPRWLRGQLLLTLELHHRWRPIIDGRLLVNPDTGELAGEYMSVEELTNVVRSNYGYTPEFDL